MSDVINMNEAWHVQLHSTDVNIRIHQSCHSYERVMSLIQTSHVNHTNESSHSYERVMCLIRTSRLIHTNESCHWYERVMSLIRTSHVTHTNESCHSYERVIACAATIHRRGNTDTCRLPATSSLATALPWQVPQQVPSYHGKASTHWVYADVCPYFYSQGPGTPSPMHPLHPPSALTLTQDWFVLKSLSTKWDIDSGIWMSQSVWDMDESWVPTPPSAFTLTLFFVLKSLSTEWDIHSGIWMRQSVWHMDDSWVINRTYLCAEVSFVGYMKNVSHINKLYLTYDWIIHVCVTRLPRVPAREVTHCRFI